MRLDKFLAENFGSRTKAAFAIRKGLVLVNGKPAEPSCEYRENDKIEILTAAESYVSVGGFKLSKALKDFNFSVKGKVFADVGASTGGFTDCLLQNGAKKVYCIDVGESQLDKSLIGPNISVIDNFNARNLSKDMFEEELDCVVIDVSFISLTYILEGVSNIIKDGTNVIALIKPQFECESRSVGKNGIVKDAEAHKKIVFKVLDFAESCNLKPLKLTDAPVVAGKNIEYLALFEKSEITQKFDKLLIKSIKL